MIENVSWQQAIGMYLAERADFTAATRRVYSKQILRFSAETGLHLAAIGRMHVVKYLQQYVNANTYNAVLSELKSFFEFASDFYDLPDPTAKLRKKKPPTDVRRRVITQAEYELIVAAPPTRGRNIAVFLANTGMRISELETLKRYDDHVCVIGKGQKPRTVPLNKTAKAVLSQLPIKLPKSDTIRDYFHRLSKKIGIEPFNPHALRHYFATRVIGKGANIADVSKVLGHASVATTIAYYYHPDNLASVVELMDLAATVGIPTSLDRDADGHLRMGVNG